MKPTNNPLVGSLGNLTQGSSGLGGSTNPGSNIAQSPMNQGVGAGKPYAADSSSSGGMGGALSTLASVGQGNPQAGANPQAMQRPQPSVLQPGQNPGGGKALLSALQAMNQFITDSTDPNSITLARGIMQIINKLMVQESDKQHQTMQQELSGGTGRSMGTIGNGSGTSPYSPSGGANAGPSTVTSPFGGAL